MKLFRGSLFLLVLLCLLISAAGQSKKSKSSTSKGKICKSISLSFPCPKGLTIKSNEKSNGVFVAYEPEDEYGVFIFSPVEKIEVTNLIDISLKNALQNLYSGDLSDYQWKDSNDFSDYSKWSKYEVTKSARVGFNKKLSQTVHLQYVHLSFNQKEIIAGFVWELAKGEEAEKEFNSWSGGGNAPASEELQNIINKISGEKKQNNPPGGPPPIALPKTN